MVDELQQAIHASKKWRVLAKARLSLIPMGWINRTFLADAQGESYVLQKVNAIFAPAVHDDIEAITAHLAKKGMITPRLVRTDDHQLCYLDKDACWRLLTFVGGQTHLQIESVKMAREAGRLVGKFHRAVADFKHKYSFARSGVHDTPQHLAKLEDALLKHRDHRLYHAVKPFADEVFEESQRLVDFSRLPRRNSHGDLKISNVLFGADKKAICLLDLDTLGLLQWPLEMGDAFRSWCNPGGEDAGEPYFEEKLFKAALESYASEAKNLWSTEERKTIVDGILSILLELSARFLRDALQESYFNYDAQRFATWGDHSLHRGSKQWLLFKDVLQKKAQLELDVKKVFE